MLTGVLDWGATEDADLQSILDEEDNVKTRIIFAREELKVRFPPVSINTPSFLWRHNQSNASILCPSCCVRTSAIAESHLYLFVDVSPTGRHCNYLPNKSSTCARRLVVRKPKDSARKSSRVKWQELPPVSSGEPSTQNSVEPHCIMCSCTSYVGRLRRRDETVKGSLQMEGLRRPSLIRFLIVRERRGGLLGLRSV